MDKSLMLDKLNAHLANLKDKYKEPRQEVKVDWVAQICGILGIPKEGIDICVQILAYKPPTKLVWLHMAECTGCSESLLRLDKPGIDALILKYISFEYHETIMGAVGINAKKSLNDALKEDFILMIEGGVSLGTNAYFLTSGADSITGEDECRHIAKHAKAIFAIGTCSSFGGIQAAYPNPTQSVGLNTFLNQVVVNIPGCPPSETNIIGSIMYYIFFQELPELDSLNRPIWSYGKNLHDMCERKAKFEAGDFVESFDDPNLQNGYCLYKVGCKGPYVFNNCPKIKFNAKTSWPVRAGHGCIACSEPDFWDSFGHIEEPLNNANSYPTKPRLLKTLEYVHSIEENIKDEILYLDFDFDTPTRIHTTQYDDLLHLSFESSFTILLQQIESKNKLGARLGENYRKWAQKHSINLESTQSMQSDILTDILYLIAQMFYGSCATRDKTHILESAQNYVFPHVSKLDFKLSGAEKYNIDVEKPLRLPIIYLLGGLEIEGVAYGAVSSMCEILSSALIELCKNYELECIAFRGELMQNPLIQDRFTTHLPKWLKVV